MLSFIINRGKKCRYYIAKIKSKITPSHEPMSDFYRRGGGNYRKRMFDMFIFIDPGTIFN